MGEPSTALGSAPLVSQQPELFQGGQGRICWTAHGLVAPVTHDRLYRSRVLALPLVQLAGAPYRRLKVDRRIARAAAGRFPGPGRFCHAGTTSDSDITRLLQVLQLHDSTSW